MINLSNYEKFTNDIDSKITEIQPLVIIGDFGDVDNINQDNALFFSSSDKVLGVSSASSSTIGADRCEFQDVGMKVSTLKDKIDLRKRTFKIKHCLD